MSEFVTPQQASVEGECPFFVEGSVEIDPAVERRAGRRLHW